MRGNAPHQRDGSVGEVFVAALRLGLTSFGGPIAHIGYFRRDYVQRRAWLGETAFAELVAFCQLLPGPSSSELGIAIGTLRAGKLGGVAAWLGFTLPSAILLTAFALLTAGQSIGSSGWVEGLKLAAVAIVAQAVWSLARTLTPDVPRALIAVATAAATLLAPQAAVQILVLAVGGAVGWLMLRTSDPRPSELRVLPAAHRESAVFLGAFALLLVALPLLAHLLSSQALALADAFYRAGSLVFGGGHLVLPLLHATVVDPGWLSNDRFLAGYGAAQAVPGPLFTVAGYLGAAVGPAPNGIAGAAIALGAIFVPAFLLVWGLLPHWARIQRYRGVRAALRGTNAAVVGILAAALITPVGTSALHTPLEGALAAVGLGALLTGRVPPVVLVATLAIIGQAAALG